MSVDIPSLLIVDDSVENLQILTALLKDSYKIKVAKSGEKAIEIARSEGSPDLILLDVVMPGLTGFEVCEVLKSDPQTQAIPIIFLTALNEVADETKGFQLGGADFIIKPFNPEIVKARIKTHIDLQNERKKSESLLSILLPQKVINALITEGEYKPETRKAVSILFCDFVGFTGITATMAPEMLFNELTEIFTAFDDICSQKGGARIKTIGDAYMAATGILEDDEIHASRLVDIGLSFIEYLTERNLKSQQQWHCRIGIHSGSVIAGIIGKSRFVYDVLGDDVNIAARVESAGTSMRVTVTDFTAHQIQPHFSLESVGEVYLKGKGEMLLHLVNRK
jgi:adenylate cyclase